VFNTGQLKQIELGIQAGVDVSIYAKPEFDLWQMGCILWGLVEGIDVTIYANPEFDWEQMFEIRIRLLEEKGDV